MYIYTDTGKNSRHNANRAMAGGYSDFGFNRLLNSFYLAKLKSTLTFPGIYTSTLDICT